MITLIKDVYVVTMNEQGDLYPDGFVVIKDQLIAAVGAMCDVSDWEKQADQIVAGQGGILIPGLINTHTHAGMISFRSLGDDVPDRLRRLLFPLEKYMTKELAAASSQYAAGEMLLSGTTTISDMYYFADDVAEACEQIGIRGLIGETIIDMPTCDAETAQDALVYTRDFISKWQSSELITPMIAPHAPNTNDGETLKAVVALAQEYQVPIMMHVAEMDYEIRDLQEKYQQSPVGWLNQLGFLDQHLIIAHAILVDSMDIELLSQAAGLVGIAHCIGANTKSAKGVAPVQQMLQAGLSVGLGTDGPSSGNTLDLFTQMKLCANFHKTHLKDRAAFPAKVIVEMATNGGAKVLGIDQLVGSIEVGKRADLTLIETQSPNMFPLYDVYNVLVYSAQAHNVQTVWVNGQKRVEHKQLVDYTVSQLRSRLQQAMTTFEQEAYRLQEK